MTPDLNEIDIHELLPQREPFVMVDRLTHFDMKRTITEFAVRADNLFVEHDEMDPCALAEIMAQTCAARLGYINKYILMRPIQIGFIGAIREMHIHAVPETGDLLETTIDLLEQIVGVTLVNATIRCRGAVVATAEMKIALTEESIQ